MACVIMVFLLCTIFCVIYEIYNDLQQNDQQFWYRLDTPGYEINNAMPVNINAYCRHR